MKKAMLLGILLLVSMTMLFAAGDKEKEGYVFRFRLYLATA